MNTYKKTRWINMYSTKKYHLDAQELLSGGMEFRFEIDHDDIEPADCRFFRLKEPDKKLSSSDIEMILKETGALTEQDLRFLNKLYEDVLNDKIWADERWLAEANGFH